MKISFCYSTGGMAGSAIAPRCGWNGLLPSWAKMFACTCWTTTANCCLQCIVYFRSTVVHFPYRHKTLKVNHCCSHGTVKGKKRKNRKKEKTSQSLYVELKIVINRACLKTTTKNNCCLFFLYKREFMTKKFSSEECDMCLYFWIWNKLIHWDIF